jgi:5-methylthioadenosine/S-adenosylhomocysteine deaminase
LTDPSRRYTARWVLPVTDTPIRDGAVLVDAEGRITAIGPASDVPAPGHAEPFDLGESVLMPGLINVHAHLDLAHLRGSIEDTSFPDWIATLLAIKRRVTLTPAETVAVAHWSCIEAVAAGITTVATTEDSDAGFQALRESGLRGIAYREVFGPDPAQAPEAIAGARTAIARMREMESDLVRVGVSPHAPFSVSDRLYRETAQLARAENLALAAHIAESQDEHDLVSQGSGIFAQRLAARGMTTSARAESPVKLLHENGILELAPLLIHCTHADATDVALIAAAGAKVAHCPIANARLGHGIAPLMRLLDAGVNVGLGTDSVASNNRLDLFDEARVAQMLQRSVQRNAALLPSSQLLHMVTIDGARALRLDQRVGSLEVGKDADLCAVSLSVPNAQPVYDVHAALFHAARASNVRLTAVKGRHLFHDGRWLMADVALTRHVVTDLAARVTREYQAGG